MIKYRAEIPEDYLEPDNIRWLEIVPHIHNELICGYFMFLYEDIHAPCKWDNWYQTLETAFEAGEGYGILKNAWEIIPE